MVMVSSILILYTTPLPGDRPGIPAAAAAPVVSMWSPVPVAALRREPRRDRAQQQKRPAGGGTGAACYMCVYIYIDLSHWIGI